MNKLLLSNEAISIAVRDFFKLYHILGVKLVLTNIILSTIFKSILRLFRKCCMKYFTKSFLYYQQGNNSLIKTLLLLSVEPSPNGAREIEGVVPLGNTSAAKCLELQAMISR